MNLLKTLEQSISLTPLEKEAISQSFKPVEFKKNTFWISQGQMCNHVGFIESGKFRIFYSDAEGNEHTCFFGTPGTFISSYTSFLTKTPTPENISAIEDSIMHVISRDELEALSDKVPKMHIWRRIVAENLYIAMEKRIQSLQSKTANERYEILLKENPDLILTIPLQYTASFLGITPQHLSRLRKNIQK